jgi:hypothetical protein
MGIYFSMLGSNVKAALTTAIFKKGLFKKPTAPRQMLDVVSLVATDVE